MVSVVFIAVCVSTSSPGYEHETLKEGINAIWDTNAHLIDKV